MYINWRHLEQEHKLEMQTSLLQFETFDAFLQWKEEEELRTKSWYIQQSAPQTYGNNKHYYYHCNRAGNYQARGNNDRSLKSQGSSKAVSHCSAYIQATVNVRECVVNVKYNSTHYNHELYTTRPFTNCNFNQEGNSKQTKTWYHPSTNFR